MAIDVDIISVSSGFSVDNINTNFSRIDTALAKAINREGGSNNEMQDDLDMNSNKIENLATPTANFDAATKKYVDDNAGDAASQAAAAAASATAAASSATAASTSAGSASTAATNASNAQTAAEAAQTAAETAETNAETAETNAETAQAAAEAAATEAEGIINAVGLKYSFSTTTTAADPGSGIIRFNNATPASVTALYIDNLDGNGEDVSGFLDVWDAASTTNKSLVLLKQITDTTKWAAFYVTNMVDSTGYRTATVSYIDGGSLPDNAADLSITVSLSGDDGTGAVNSVNGFTGTVTLGSDDIDDTGETHQFATAAQLAKVDYLTVTGAIDLDANNTKLAGIESGAEANDVDSVAGLTGAITAGGLRTAINVEDGADVTDATNVDAAGAVMNSDTTTAAMSFVVDEDTMSSNSATKVPTQQSVKAYVDANAGTALMQPLIFGPQTAYISSLSSVTLQEVTASGDYYPYLEFPESGSTPDVCWTGILPDTYGGGDLRATIYFFPAVTGGDVDWSLEIVNMEDGATGLSSLNGGATTSNNNSISGTGYHKVQVDMSSLDSLTAGEPFYLVLSRNQVSDTNENSMYVNMVKLEEIFV